MVETLRTLKKYVFYIDTRSRWIVHLDKIVHKIGFLYCKYKCTHGLIIRQRLFLQWQKPFHGSKGGPRGWYFRVCQQKGGWCTLVKWSRAQLPAHPLLMHEAQGQQWRLHHQLGMPPSKIQMLGAAWSVISEHMPNAPILTTAEVYLATMVSTRFLPHMACTEDLRYV